MSFDRLARHYSWMEAVLAGRKLHECRIAFLDEARTAQRILLVGEGHGRFLAEVCRVNPAASITCVDESPEMLRVAKERVTDGGPIENVRFEAVPILQFETADRFDLIATHFFLDCFEGEELERVVAKLAGLLPPGGRWIISDFHVPERGWRWLRARVVLALAYAFFRATVRLPARRLVDPSRMLAANGLRRLQRKESNYGLLYAELWGRPAR